MLRCAITDPAENVGSVPTDKDIRTAARLMADQLSTSGLTVVLIPSRVPEIAAQGGKIRAVESRNPPWYRDLCAQYTANRTRPRKRAKHDTLIKRRSVIAALDAISRGRNGTVYISRVLPFVEDVAAGHYDHRWYDV